MAGEVTIGSQTEALDKAAGARLLSDLTRGQLEAELAGLGVPPYRADQVWKWVYSSLAPDVASMSNLPRDLRADLNSRFAFPGLREVTRIASQKGDTQKVLFRLWDGETIESVLMHYQRRHTVCVSSQVGCAVGCPFCATGQAGFRRNLSAGEIAEQAIFFARVLAQEGKRVTHIVLMGMGEPLLNYENVLQAIETWNDEVGFALGARHITLSTAGVVPGIDRLSKESLQIGLSVSLHAADDALRNHLVPLNRRYPLTDLLAACQRYMERTNRRVTFEYVLIDDLNDSPAQAESLAALLTGLLCHVNLIPLNSGSPGLKGGRGPSPRHTNYTKSARERVDRFCEILESHSVPVTVRLGRGVDIQAACGQLRFHQVTES